MSTMRNLSETAISRIAWAAWGVVVFEAIAELTTPRVFLILLAGAAVLSICAYQARRAQRTEAKMDRQTDAVVGALGENAEVFRQQTGALVKELRHNTDRITDRVLSFDHIYGLAIKHDKIAEIEAARRVEEERDSTGPFRPFRATN